MDKNGSPEEGHALSASSIERMYSYYLLAQHAKELEQLHISSRQLAENLAIGDTQVRKDFAALGVVGQPKHGYRVDEAIARLREAMGLDQLHPTVVCGVGHLGTALLKYSRFGEFGFRVVGAFDVDRKVVGEDVGGVRVLPIAHLEDVIRIFGVEIGVLTVPVWAAQDVCDVMVAAGVRAIWNFAPLHLEAPKQVLVRDEDFAGSLTVISHFLKKGWG
jgi:redox-sensing transcriptional repressor